MQEQSKSASERQAEVLEWMGTAYGRRRIADSAAQSKEVAVPAFSDANSSTAFRPDWLAGSLAAIGGSQRGLIVGVAGLVAQDSQGGHSCHLLVTGGSRRVSSLSRVVRCVRWNWPNKKAADPGDGFRGLKGCRSGSQSGRPRAGARVPPLSTAPRVIGVAATAP